MMWFRCVLVLVCITSASPLMAQSSRSYVAGSLRLARPQGALQDSLGLGQSLQFDVRYLWSPTRTLEFGVGGSWLTASTGNPMLAGVPQADLSLTQITATGTWRMLKHGISPFAGLEGGFGYLIPASDTLAAHASLASTLGACYGAHVGLEVPLSERLQLSLSGRWTRLTTQTPLDLMAASVALVYRLQ